MFLRTLKVQFIQKNPEPRPFKAFKKAVWKKSAEISIPKAFTPENGVLVFFFVFGQEKHLVPRLIAGEAWKSF